MVAVAPVSYKQETVPPFVVTMILGLTLLLSVAEKIAFGIDFIV